MQQLNVIEESKNFDYCKVLYRQSGHPECQKCNAIIKKCFDKAKRKREATVEAKFKELSEMTEEDAIKMFEAEYGIYNGCNNDDDDNDDNRKKVREYMYNTYISDLYKRNMHKCDLTNIKNKLIVRKINEIYAKAIDGNLTITPDMYETYFNKNFSNNTEYSISIIFDADEQYEIAFLEHGRIVYDTPFSNDVIHELLFEEVRDYADAFHIWSQNPEYCKSLEERTSSVDRCYKTTHTQ